MFHRGERSWVRKCFYIAVALFLAAIASPAQSGAKHTRKKTMQPSSAPPSPKQPIVLTISSVVTANIDPVLVAAPVSRVVHDNFAQTDGPAVTAPQVTPPTTKRKSSSDDSLASFVSNMLPELSCALCSALLVDPVMLPCSHGYWCVEGLLEHLFLATVTSACACPLRARTHSDFEIIVVSAPLVHCLYGLLLRVYSHSLIYRIFIVETQTRKAV